MDDKLRALAKEYRRLKEVYEASNAQNASNQQTIAQLSAKVADNVTVLTSQSADVERASKAALAGRTEVAKISRQLMALKLEQQAARNAAGLTMPLLGDADAAQPGGAGASAAAGAQPLVVTQACQTDFFHEAAQRGGPVVPIASSDGPAEEDDDVPIARPFGVVSGGGGGGTSGSQQHSGAVTSCVVNLDDYSDEGALAANQVTLLLGQHEVDRVTIEQLSVDLAHANTTMSALQAKVQQLLLSQPPPPPPPPQPASGDANDGSEAATAAAAAAGSGDRDVTSSDPVLDPSLESNAAEISTRYS